MLIRPDEQAVSSILDSLMRHTLQRVEDKSCRATGSYTLVKILGVQGSGVFWDILCKVRDKLLLLVSFTARKKHSLLVALFQFWRHYIPYLGMQDRPLQQIQAMIQAALLHESYGLKNSVVLEVSVVGKGDVWILWQSTVGEFQHRSLRFWSNVMPSAVKKVSSFEKHLLAYD